MTGRVIRYLFGQLSLLFPWRRVLAHRVVDGPGEDDREDRQRVNVPGAVLSAPGFFQRVAIAYSLVARVAFGRLSVAFSFLFVVRGEDSWRETRASPVYPVVLSFAGFVYHFPVGKHRPVLGGLLLVNIPCQHVVRWLDYRWGYQPKMTRRR